MITLDDLQKIYKFGMDEAAHYYRCKLNSNTAEERAFNFGADYATRIITEKIYLLMEREKKAEGLK